MPGIGCAAEQTVQGYTYRRCGVVERAQNEVLKVLDAIFERSHFATTATAKRLAVAGFFVSKSVELR